MVDGHLLLNPRNKIDLALTDLLCMVYHLPRQLSPVPRISGLWEGLSHTICKLLLDIAHKQHKALSLHHSDDPCFVLFEGFPASSEWDSPLYWPTPMKVLTNQDCAT